MITATLEMRKSGN